MGVGGWLTNLLLASIIIRPWKSHPLRDGAPLQLLNRDTFDIWALFVLFVGRVGRGRDHQLKDSPGGVE